LKLQVLDFRNDHVKCAMVISRVHTVGTGPPVTTPHQENDDTAKKRSPKFISHRSIP